MNILGFSVLTTFFYQPFRLLPSTNHLIHPLQFDDNASGIHFTTGRRHRGSSNSLSSLAGSMRRVNTAGSIFKRFLSRSDSQSQPHTPSGTDGVYLGIPGNSGKMPKSASNASLAGSKILPPPARITDQVIEEVDEQQTITSMRQEIRPKAEDLFNQGPLTMNTPQQQQQQQPPSGPPPASKPVDVPMRTLGGPSSHTFTINEMNHPYMERNDNEFVSCSAPSTQFRPPTPTGFDEYDRYGKDGGSIVGGGGAGVVGDGDATTLAGGEDADDFEKLRLARERERTERQRLNIARSISTTQGSNPTNLNVDLVEALAASIADDINHSAA